MQEIPPIPNPEPILPTRDDLQNIEIQASGLGNGALVHEIGTRLGVLRNIFEQSKEKGWSEWLLKSYYEQTTAIQGLIVKRRLEKAAESNHD